MAQRWRTALRKLVPVFFSFEELRVIESKIASDPGSDIEAIANLEEHPLKLARSLKYLLRSGQEADVDWPNKFDKRLINAWRQEMQLSQDESFFPDYIPKAAPAPARRLQAAAEVSNDHRHLDDYGLLKLTVTREYGIGDDFLGLAGSSAPAAVDELMVTVLGAARNNSRGVVLRVVWESEVWWLKMGPEAETRRKALQALDDESPAGAWERWFQTERDMLSRSLLSSSEAFAVVVAAARNRPAMLVKDAGDSLEKRLLASQKMEPAQVYEMSKQLYTALEACCNKGVVHGDVCLENICEKKGSYSLIDWGLACGRPFEELAAAVGKAWPAVDHTPGIPNWEMSPDCYFLGMRPSRVEHDLESLLYCCIKLLGGNTLPWSHVAASGTELDVLNVRTATVASSVKAHQRHIYRPLLLKLGLVAREFKEKEKPGNIPASAVQESGVSA